jgi:aminopeptidase N
MHMRIPLIIILLLSTIISFAQRTVDANHYRYHIDLNDVNDSIKCGAMIVVTAKEATKTISFDLKTVRNGKGMKVEEVGSATGDVKFEYKHEQDQLQIMLPNELKKGDTAHISISYRGIPGDGLIISKNKFGRRTFFADNWPDRGRNWLPCIEDPADKASVEFLVVAPDHYQVVANGVQVEESDMKENKKLTHWREDVPISTKVMVIGVADFSVQLSGVIDQCIPVYSWVYPENRLQGFHDYSQAAEIMPYFIRNVGPYGYKKLANVQSKTTFGGLENANTIFYAESSVTGTRKSEGLLAHEIAHQWFGNMATEKSFAHLWLSEGFATYMTILYMENKYGTDTARKMLMEDRQQVIEFVRSSDRTVVDNDRNYLQLLNPNSYQKGGWILHMLRRQLGDSVFWRGVRKYYARYAGKTADSKDFASVFEEVSGKKLETFFGQWLYAPGIPQLNVNWKHLHGENKVEIMVEQVQRGATIFQFPLKIKVGEKIHEIAITKRSEKFTITVKEHDVRIKLDPDVSLLFSATINQLQ